MRTNASRGEVIADQKTEEYKNTLQNFCKSSETDLTRIPCQSIHR